jgi:hypothetical protein
MRISRVAAAFALVALASSPACGSFQGTDTSSPEDAATDASDAKDGGTADGSPAEGGATVAKVSCGADTCTGPALCCYPPDGPTPPPPACVANAGACTGDNVALYCDDPADCPTSWACCVTIAADHYRMSAATCRKSCGDGDASSSDIRLCNPALGAASGCIKGDCVPIGEANKAITGGIGLQIKSGLYGCNAN